MLKTYEDYRSNLENNLSTVSKADLAAYLNTFDRMATLYAPLGAWSIVWEKAVEDYPRLEWD